MAGSLITVAETAVFQRQAALVWGEDERLAFIDFIAATPDAGDLIPDTGGLRKVRWSRPGRGKRGGVRIIYFFHDTAMPLYLLMVYAKSRQDNWSAAEKRRIGEVVTAIRSAHQRKGTSR
jgi:mRNA-degrading endonuclease RelE of RelBE toxin-antitoxin system